jgi:hypothetical protein
LFSDKSFFARIAALFKEKMRKYEAKLASQFVQFIELLSLNIYFQMVRLILFFVYCSGARNDTFWVTPTANSMHRFAPGPTSLRRGLGAKWDAKFAEGAFLEHRTRQTYLKMPNYRPNTLLI